ncbi:MAG: hypothetical protein AB1894_08510 [Chloroflexota bacterium]
MKTVLKLTLVLVILAALLLPLAALGVARLAWQSAYAVSGAGLAVALPESLPGSLAGSLVDTTLDLSRGPWQQGPDGDRLVLGGTFTLDEDETLDGSLVVLGGFATLKPGSRVNRDAVVLGGALNVDGTVEGNMVAIGGNINLGETAVVGGDINVLGGNVTRAEGARVEGSVNVGEEGGFPIVIPGRVYVPEINPSMDFGMGVGGMFVKMLWVLLRSFMWLCLAALVVLFVPENSTRAGQVAASQTLTSGGLGLLTVMVAPLMLAVFAITIIGLPVTLVGAFLLVIAWAYGVIVIGLLAGQRLAQALHQEWAPAVSAALGAAVVTLVGNTVGALVPCIGWMLPALVGMIGLGAVMLTRFGTQNYPIYASSAAARPAAPAADEPVLAVSPVVDAPAADAPAADEETPSE